MADLLKYAAAGALSGLGRGIVDRAAAAEAAAMENLRRSYDVEDRDLRRQWQIEDRDLAFSRKGLSSGGSSGGSSRSSGGSTATGGLAPSSRASLTNAMGDEMQGPPVAPPPKVGGMEPIGEGETLRGSPRWNPDLGVYTGVTSSGKAVYMGEPQAPEAATAGGETAAKPKEMTATQWRAMEDAFAGEYSDGLSAEELAVVAPAIEDKMGQGATFGAALAEVMAQLQREEIVTNKPGTVLSRTLGMDDGIPDETKAGKITGLKGASAVEPAAPGTTPEVQAVIDKARAAIAAGADPAAVRKRLVDYGITPPGDL